MNEKARLESELASKIIPDVAYLKRKWDIVSRISAKLNDYRNDMQSKSSIVYSLTKDQERISREEKAWRARIDTTCPHCGQTVGRDYVMHICEPFSGQISEIQQKIATERETMSKIDGLLSATQKKIEEVGPKQMVAEAEAMVREAGRIKAQIDRKSVV